MIRIIVLACSLLLLPWASPFALIAQEKMQIAVLSFKIHENRTENYAKNHNANQSYHFLSEQIPAMLESRLVREESFQLQERRKISQVLKELEYVQLGILDEKKAVEAAKLLQADYIVSGEIFIFESSHVVLCETYFRVIRTDDGKIIFNARLEKTSLAELMLNIERTASMLSGYIQNKKTARLSIVTVPAYADVYLNGNYFGKSPLIDIDVIEGRYQLKIVKDNYVSYDKDLDVKKENPTNIETTLAFQGYAVFKNRFRALTSFYRANLDYRANAFTSPVVFHSFQIGYEYMLFPFALSANLDIQYNAQRSHELNIFGQTFHEQRSIRQRIFGIKAGYNFLLSPRFVAMAVSVSLAARALTETLESEDRDYPPYQNSWELLQPIVHLGFDLFPAARLGLLFEVDVLLYSRLKTFNGEFNPTGAKKFHEISLSASEVSFKMGVRVSFDDFEKSTWGSY